MKSGDYELKLADFGLAKSSEMPYFSNSGSLLYMAPEQRKPIKPGEKKKLTSKVDIYPVGLMFLELLIGKNPEKAGCFTLDEGIDN